MTDLEKPKPPLNKKPPTQTAGVTGIDAHGGMGEAPEQSIPNNAYIDWHKLINLPAFEMFVLEQSGLQVGSAANDWVKQRRATLSDSVFYNQYASWHEQKGLWVNETPMGNVIASDSL